jgi:hypothetical protein
MWGKSPLDPLQVAFDRAPGTKPAGVPVPG